MTTARRATRLEHRLTSANATIQDLDVAIGLALAGDLAAITVSPWLVKAAKRQLGRSRMRLGTVGDSSTASVRSPSWSPER